MIINFAHHATRLRNIAQNTKDKDALEKYYHAKRVLDFQNGCAREDDHYSAAGLCPCCQHPLDNSDDYSDLEIGEERRKWNLFRKK